MATYDLAVSFAGEQRALARRISERLDGSGYSIFFDEFHQGSLWGSDLTIALNDVYEHDARWCLILTSKEYVEKAWPNLERQNALSRFIRERTGYLLCLRVDDTLLPGLPATIGYLDLRTSSEDAVHGLLLQKLGRPSHDDRVAGMAESDRELARSVIAACYRRAIFTRMVSEIDLPAMYDSIGEAIGQLQRLIPTMVDQRLQFLALRLVRSLDEIERFRNASSETFSLNLSKELRSRIDAEKIEAIRLLLDIRRSAAIGIQLPTSLRVAHFFTREAAREPPGV
ncbi:MAG TPA: TIR domain-containing protein [Polyangiaceae bacterium]|nr:TIR domain-containing protein [Polyangiaceae bacterium]